jgi:hypothetical protein
MESFATAVSVVITLSLVFGLGTWFYRRLTSAIATHLSDRWRWLALLMTAAISFVVFLLLRPLVLDKPMDLPWFVVACIAVALLVSGATALGYGIVEAGRAVIATLRRL